MYDIVALGELLIDFACTGVDELGYPKLEAHPGGGPANFLGAVAMAGGKTAFMTKVGADSFGDLLVKTMEELAIDTCGIVRDENTFTTLAFVTIDANGDRSFSFARKPGADTQLRFDELDWSLIDSTRAFHFGTLSLTDEPARSATYRAVAHARMRGALVTFDPNLRPPLWHSLDDARTQILWGLSQADVVKISDNEVEFLFGCSPEEGARRILSEFGVKLVFVTCGADGSFFMNARASGHVDGYRKAPPVDTTGAGDIFGGSAVWKLLESGCAPEELSESQLRSIVEYATNVAGISTTRFGGISSIPKKSEL